jgi:peroxiredoxin
MLRLAVVVLILSNVLCATPNKAVLESARRIETLAAKESMQARVDTRLRAAQLLAGPAPDISGRFLKAALADLGQISVSRRIVISLMALDEERGAEHILNSRDKRTAYDLLINYWASRAQAIKAASLLGQAAREGVTAISFNPAFWRGVTAASPVKAVDLVALTLANPKLMVPPTATAQAAGLVSTALTTIARQNPEQARAALRQLLILVQSQEFQKAPGRAGPYSVSLAGTAVQVAGSHEVVKLRLGALAKVIDPETYTQQEAGLEKWSEALATVKALEQVSVGPIPEAPASPVPFNLQSAMENLKRQPRLSEKIRAAQELMNRPEPSLEQKQAAALYVIPQVESITDPAERSHLASLLLDDYAIYLLGKPILERVAQIHLDGTNRSDQDPEAYGNLAQLIDAFNLNIGSETPSIGARLELYRLGRLISDQYDFTLPSLSGTKVSLRSFRGKAVLLNFWATWCPPCRSEMPILEKLHRDFAASGFTVLAVSDEDRSTVQKYMKEFGYTFPVLLDPDRRVFDHFRVLAIPATKVFSRDGTLIAELENTTEAELRQQIETAQRPSKTAR